MSKIEKHKLLPIARSLFASGYSPAGIAESLDVSERTLRRWRSGDDQDWSREREDRRSRDPQDLMEELERLMRMVMRDESLEPAAKADAVAKLDRRLASLQERFDDPAVKSYVAEDIAKWVSRHMGDAEKNVMRKVLVGYVDDVYEEKKR